MYAIWDLELGFVVGVIDLHVDTCCLWQKVFIKGGGGGHKVLKVDKALHKINFFDTS